MLILYSIAVVLLLFGATIFVHELGHFLVARWCGMVVDVFSIGFGPALWKKKRGGITYKIGIIPFGGYVALPQMDSGAAEPAGPDETPRALPPAAAWKKILVALAGVTGNMLLAVLLAYVVFWGGQSFAPKEGKATVGFVVTNSQAYTRGLRIGDVIEAVNGQPVDSWEKAMITCAFYDEVALHVRRSSGEVTTITVPTEKFMGNRYLEGVGPLNYCYVLRVEPRSSAEEAGIRSGDKIIELNGVPLYSREHLISLVDEHRDQQVPAKVEREGRVVEVQVRPRYNESVGRALIGVVFSALDVRPPGVQIKSWSTTMLRLLRALVTPREAKAAASSMGGPVAIFQMFWWYVQTSFIAALWFTGLLNVNLALINLLPVPVLDGGHILFALWELVTRRPVHPKVAGALVNFFAVLIITFFLWITYRDILRLPAVLRIRKAMAEAPTNAAPAATEPSK